MAGDPGTETVTTALQTRELELKAQIEDAQPPVPTHVSACRLSQKISRKQTSYSKIKEQLLGAKKSLKDIQERCSQTKQELGELKEQFRALDTNLTDQSSVESMGEDCPDTQMDSPSEGKGTPGARLAKRRRGAQWKRASQEAKDPPRSSCVAW